MKRAAVSLCCLMILTPAARGEDRTIEFAGMTWNVREGQGRLVRIDGRRARRVSGSTHAVSST